MRRRTAVVSRAAGFAPPPFTPLDAVSPRPELTRRVMPVAAQAQGRALMVAAGGTVKKMPPVTLGEGAQEGSSWTALAAACVSVATGSLPDGGQPLLDFLAGTHLRDEWSGEMAPRTAAKALALVSACMDDECE